MAGFETSGHLIAKAAKVTGQGQKGPWAKQEFVIETLDKDYPKKIAFAAWNDTIEKLRPFQKNQVIRVSFSAESREHSGRYYTELRAFKIEEGETVTPKTPTARQSAPQPKQVYEEDNWGAGSDDGDPF